MGTAAVELKPIGTFWKMLENVGKYAKQGLLNGDSQQELDSIQYIDMIYI